MNHLDGPGALVWMRKGDTSLISCEHPLCVGLLETNGAVTFRTRLVFTGLSPAQTAAVLKATCDICGERLIK